MSDWALDLGGEARWDAGTGVYRRRDLARVEALDSQIRAVLERRVRLVYTPLLAAQTKQAFQEQLLAVLPEYIKTAHAIEVLADEHGLSLQVGDTHASGFRVHIEAIGGASLLEELEFAQETIDDSLELARGFAPVEDQHAAVDSSLAQRHQMSVLIHGICCECLEPSVATLATPQALQAASDLAAKAAFEAYYAAREAEHLRFGDPSTRGSDAALVHDAADELDEIALEGEPALRWLRDPTAYSS
ncbi:MAG: hypothetical protein IPL19_09200 [Sandaracinaceae bacterium]|jgi:hypothetical protein|nr:hypothetical protein [Sandaracinaceae bacterium]